MTCLFITPCSFFFFLNLGPDTLSCCPKSSLVHLTLKVVSYNCSISSCFCHLWFKTWCPAVSWVTENCFKVKLCVCGIFFFPLGTNGLRAVKAESIDFFSRLFYGIYYKLNTEKNKCIFIFFSWNFSVIMTGFKFHVFVRSVDPVTSTGPVFVRSSSKSLLTCGIAGVTVITFTPYKWATERREVGYVVFQIWLLLRHLWLHFKSWHFQG